MRPFRIHETTDLGKIGSRNQIRRVQIRFCYFMGTYLAKSVQLEIRIRFCSEQSHESEHEVRGDIRYLIVKEALTP